LIWRAGIPSGKILKLKPRTLHPKPDPLNSKLSTLNPNNLILKPEPQTQNTGQVARSDRVDTLSRRGLTGQRTLSFTALRVHLTRNGCLQRRMDILVPNNQRQRRTCLELCHLLNPVSVVVTPVTLAGQSSHLDAEFIEISLPFRRSSWRTSWRNNVLVHHL
jgi:hypothetical protein